MKMGKMGNDRKITSESTFFAMRVESDMVDCSKSRSEFARLYESNDIIHLELHRAKNGLKMMVMTIFENGKKLKIVKNMENLEKRYKISSELIDKLIDQFYQWFNDAENLEVELQVLNLIGVCTKLRNEVSKSEIT